MKVSIHTLGCKVNHYDSQVILSDLSAQGYEIVSPEEADVIIINTCAVTNESERKSRQLIRKYKREHPQSIIVVSGCFSEIDLEAVKQSTDADIITGTHNRSQIPNLIEQFIQTKEKYASIDSYKSVESIPTDFYDKTRATIKIQDGCNMFCTYCIIPYARGTISCVPQQRIIDHINHLSAKGYKEIVLTGIHISSYIDDDGKRLIDLLQAIDSSKSIARLRLGSLEPRLLNEKFLSRLEKVDCFCPHFHVSLQSGSDKILERMNRKYSIEEYEKNISSIKNIFPNAMITTDVIVGFPGETEQMFLETIDVIERVGFSHVHVFPYSPKKGTPAAEYPEQIDKHTKRERVERLITLNQTIQQGIYKSSLGHTYEVLVEKMDTNGLCEGYSRNYLPIAFYSDIDLSNQIVSVQVNDYSNDKLIGVLKEHA